MSTILNIDGFRLIQSNVVRKPKSQKLKERKKKQSIREDTLSVILRVIKEYRVLTTANLMSYTDMASATVRKYVGELKHRGHITTARDYVNRKTTITFVKG